MELKLTQSCPPPNILKTSAFFDKNPQVIFLSSLHLARCKLHLQRISWNSKDKKSLAHVVRREETLTSISKLFGVPILEISTADKDIVDGDLVFEGHHPGAPSPIITYAQVAKTTGSFLVLVPLVAFCIRCIMVAIRSRYARDLRNQEPKMSGVHHRMSKSTRWITALRDLRDPDAMDTEFEPDSAHVSEDEDQPYINEHSRDYAKVEDEYQNFLSECGMSEWGYWRGGSPK
ncbi:hypothetical protein F511_05983 [Dorcoceras hygrometricum]|uniref:Uncharacterized protein n=1 Tax=Dorcoceras hygrometricum TaxID=472368 RepID=A0A2Z7DBA1_9LAMI|nr:hypothetical protein F511_05983 [Dorcoceras hygrometricum]